jgi:hypothetical protein
MKRPLQGICQGNGGGPAFWYAVSIVLVLLLYRKGHGARFKSVFAKEEAMMVAGLLFVDDTDLFAFVETITTHPNEVIADLQAAVLTWQAGLHSTGGTLKPEKCSWSLLAYRFAKGHAYIHTPHSHPGGIFLHTSDGPTAIKWVAATEGITAVGVIQALNGKMKLQVDELQEKADKWANKVKEGWMDPCLAWTCLRSMIWPSLSYPLWVCSISKNQGDAIIVQLYQALLPELGLQQKFPKIWRYALHRFQALALPHPYFIQGQEQICLFQQLGLSNEISGGLLRISLAQAQLELGQNVPLLQDDYKTWGFLLTQNLWIGSMWEFCDEYNITLEAGRFQAPEIQRDNDIFIMQLFEEHFNFTGRFQECQQQWRVLNHRHLSLQVLFLSDITSVDGTCIE